MSDDVLRLIPADPTYAPPEAARSLAVAALERLLPEGERCEARDYGHVTFIDQGENIEAILCPSCSRRLSLFDPPEAEKILEWWYAATDPISEGAVEAIQVAMPCCSASVPLTTLKFDWPAGFARFELSISNPGIGENLSAEQLASFEEILGCRLVQVRAHY